MHTTRVYGGGLLNTTICWRERFYLLNSRTLPITADYFWHMFISITFMQFNNMYSLSPDDFQSDFSPQYFRHITPTSTSRVLPIRKELRFITFCHSSSIVVLLTSVRIKCDESQQHRQSADFSLESSARALVDYVIIRRIIGRLPA